MEVPRKRAKTCPGSDLKDDGGASATAAQQIAELQAELDNVSGRTLQRRNATTRWSAT